MDVHRKRSQVALVDEHGVQLANRNLANDSAELVAVLGRLEPGTPVAFEAAYGWGWLAELALPAVQHAIVADCLALIDAISPLVARLERDLLARARPDPRVQALQALPGIGPITAMTLVAEIGDIARFPTARKLCAWARLIPAVRNSDRKGPPRPHHQDGLAMGPLRAPGSRPAGQDPPAVRQLLRPDRGPPRQAHRHRGGRPQAACSQLPPAHRTPSHDRRRSTRRVRSPHHMCLNHGRRTD
jgi:hypothetical protein